MKQLIEEISAAINANNGKCAVIENALTKSLDLAMRFCGDGKPSIKTISLLGESFIEVSDGVNTVKLQVSKEGIDQLIGELQTVHSMADEDLGEDDLRPILCDNSDCQHAGRCCAFDPEIECPVLTL